MYACMDAVSMYVCVCTCVCVYVFTYVYRLAQREGGRVNITCHGKDKFHDFCLILILFTVQSFSRHPYFSFYRMPTNKVNKIPFPSPIQWTRAKRGEARDRKRRGWKVVWALERREGGRCLPSQGLRGTGRRVWVCAPRPEDSHLTLRWCISTLAWLSVSDYVLREWKLLCDFPELVNTVRSVFLRLFYFINILLILDNMV